MAPPPNSMRNCYEGDPIRCREYFCCDGLSNAQRGSALSYELDQHETLGQLSVDSCPLYASRSLQALLCATKIWRAVSPALFHPRPWRPLCPTRAWPSGCAPRLSRPQFRPSDPASERAWRKARPMVRLVDANPKGWRTRAQPCGKLAVLGPSHWPTHRRGRCLASPCRHDHGTGRQRRVDRKVRQ